MRSYPSGGRRWRQALLWAAIVSFMLGLMLYLWGQTATIDAYYADQPSPIDLRDALNAVAGVFWLTFGVFYLIHVRRTEDDLHEERSAVIAEAWMDRRRLTLLRERSRRR